MKKRNRNYSLSFKQKAVELNLATQYTVYIQQYNDTFNIKNIIILTFIVVNISLY